MSGARDCGGVLSQPTSSKVEVEDVFARALNVPRALKRRQPCTIPPSAPVAVKKLAPASFALCL